VKSLHMEQTISVNGSDAENHPPLSFTLGE